MTTSIHPETNQGLSKQRIEVLGLTLFGLTPTVDPQGGIYEMA